MALYKSLENAHFCGHDGTVCAIQDPMIVLTPVVPPPAIISNCLLIALPYKVPSAPAQGRTNLENSKLETLEYHAEAAWESGS